MKRRFLVYGSLNIDHFYELDHLVREGETISSASYRKSEGGKGLNQAIALAKAGCEVYMAGAIGSDGLFLKKYLEETGVHTDYVSVRDIPTGHALIQVDKDGKNSIILFPGSNHSHTREEAEEVLNAFGEGDILLMQNEIASSGISFPAFLMEKAKERGLTIVLNPSPMTEKILTWPLEKVDLFLLNEVEGEDITGEKEPEKILRKMRERFPLSGVVLTLGEKGSLYADDSDLLYQEALKVKAVDTTAAGDTFTGYFLSSYFAGESAEKALKLASKAAAMAVMRAGASRSIPVKNEVEKN